MNQNYKSDWLNRCVTLPRQSGVEAKIAAWRCLAPRFNSPSGRWLFLWQSHINDVHNMRNTCVLCTNIAYLPLQGKIDGIRILHAPSMISMHTQIPGSPKEKGSRWKRVEGTLAVLLTWAIRWRCFLLYCNIKSVLCYVMRVRACACACVCVRVCVCH